MEEIDISQDTVSQFWLRGLCPSSTLDTVYKLRQELSQVLFRYNVIWRISVVILKSKLYKNQCYLQINIILKSKLSFNFQGAASIWRALWVAPPLDWVSTCSPESKCWCHLSPFDCEFIKGQNGWWGTQDFQELGQKYFPFSPWSIFLGIIFCQL